MSRPGSADDAGPSKGEVCTDILSRINERESEIERILNAAHEAAEATLVEARRAAAEVVATRRAEADRLSAQAGEQIVALARLEADAIRAAAASDAAAVLATPPQRIELAADRMLAVLIPGAHSHGEAP